MSHRRIRNQALAVLCRKLGIMLEAGVPIRKAFRTAEKKADDPQTREAMSAVSRLVAAGEDVSSALKQQGRAFPPLMLDLVRVGEDTGALPECLRSLAMHYENLVQLRRKFLAQILWPMIQLVASILLIAVLLLLLQWIANLKGGEPLQILPFGLTGVSGAVIWLVFCFGSLAAIWGGYRIAARRLEGRKAIHGFLLRIPKLGRCLQSFAVARFSWAFALTQQAGMSIEPSLRSSLNATGNGAFQATADQAWRQLQSGDSLGQALRATRVFPSEFVEMVETADYTGTVPEMLEHLRPQFEENAQRDLKQLTSMASWGLWACVAAFIIFLIFRIALIYIGQIQEFAR